MKRKINRNTILNIAIVVLAVICAALCRYFDRLAEIPVLRICRSLIYIVLFLWWGVMLRKRIVQVQAKRFMTAISFLIVFWVLVRTVKFIFVENPTVIRLLWYSYYIPMIFIPVLSLLVTLSLEKSENYQISGVKILLFSFSAILVATVLTNDYHCFVFKFPENVQVWSDSDYSYSFGYCIIAIFILFCTVSALAVLIYKCRIPKTKKMIVLPVIPVALMVIYSVLYACGAISSGTILHKISGDMTITASLLIMLTFECCIYSGLIRSNTHYIELLCPCTLQTLITDDDYNVLLASDCAEMLSKEEMRSAEKMPVTISRGKRLSSTKIKGGHVLWFDDLSELEEINEKLAEMKDDLKEEYDLLCEEYELKNREAHILERDRIYDRIQKDTAGQIKALNSLIDRFELEENENERKKLLGRMVIIGAYLKRRNNLIFLSEKSDMISEKELYLAFRELIDNLELYGVTCGLDIKADTPLPSCTITEMFDTFEKILELSLESITAVNVVINRSANACKMTVISDAVSDLSILNGSRISAVRDDDGEWQITYTGEAEKCLT